jgi:hypothetical protein
VVSTRKISLRQTRGGAAYAGALRARIVSLEAPPLSPRSFSAAHYFRLLPADYFVFVPIRLHLRFRVTLRALCVVPLDFGVGQHGGKNICRAQRIFLLQINFLLFFLLLFILNICNQKICYFINT